MTTTIITSPQQLQPGDVIPNPYPSGGDWTIVSITGNDCVIRWEDGSETVGALDGSGIAHALELMALTARCCCCGNPAHMVITVPTDASGPAGTVYCYDCASSTCADMVHIDDALDTRTPRADRFQPYVSMAPRELRPGMLVQAHGMLCLVRDEPTLSRSHPFDERTGGCFYTKTLVVNRYAVSNDSVPYSFTQPRKSNGYADDEAIARGEHHWSLQGNDLAQVAVLVHGPQPMGGQPFYSGDAR